jgi:hypothetical protein
MNKTKTVSITLAILLIILSASVSAVSTNLFADVLRGNSLVRGDLRISNSLFVRDNLLVRGDLGVIRNQWGTQIIKGEKTEGFIECPEGSFQIAYNPETEEIKCSTL